MNDVIASRGTDRFLAAQDAQTHPNYADALAEIRSGRKTSHWIWFVFPQVRGLGSSQMSDYYGIRGIDEAVAYLRDDVLRSRLVEISDALLKSCGGKPLGYAMGLVDAMKVQSSMTLFEEASLSLLDSEDWADDVLTATSSVLNAFFAGERCWKTLDKLNIKAY